MKKQVSPVGNAARKTILRFGIIAFMVLNFVSPVNAQTKSAGKDITVRYVGVMEDQPVFQVEFDNAESKLYNVSITNEDGEILYTEKVTDKKFSRKFRFEKGGPEEVKLNFTITGQKEKQTQSFEINTNIRMVQDVVVTKL